MEQQTINNLTYYKINDLVKCFKPNKSISAFVRARNTKALVIVLEDKYNASPIITMRGTWVLKELLSTLFNYGLWE